MGLNDDFKDVSVLFPFQFLVAGSLLTLETSKSSCTWPTLREALPFAVPAVLYSINNNLAILMQVHMDPATYQVWIRCLMQLSRKHKITPEQSNH